MTRRLPPAALLVVATALVLAFCGAMILTAHHQPWLGLRLAWDAKAGGARVVAARGPAAAIPAGTVLVAVRGGDGDFALQAQDFTVEPDGAFADFDAYRVFLGRQGALHRMQASGEVVLADASGRAWTVRPAPTRPLDDLPPEFWVQIVTGAVSFLISAAIWAFRRGETSARYLLLSGAAIMVSAGCAAPYTTRELAMAPGPFRVIDDLNFLGGSLFAAALAALLLYYPKRLAPRWAGWAIVAVFVVWFVAQEVELITAMAFARRILVMIAILSAFVLSAVHWRLTRRDPIARASLQWFLLSWVICTGVFCCLVLGPQLFGVDTSGLQSYGFGVFLLLYAGLAFGILRFRLFELGEWWGRVMGWFAALVALIVFDLVFMAGLGLSQTLSLSLALLVCGMVWLPARAWLTTRLFRRDARHERARFETIVEVAFAREDEVQSERWTALLRAVFDPLRIEPLTEPAPPGLHADGLALVTPAVDRLPAYRLEYAHAGRRLFNRRDVAQAGELDGMLRYVLQSRNAYEDGVAIERRRIAGDIHDNLGAPLVRALHSPEAERKDALIRETLADLRGIINDAARPGASLAGALADIRLETARRAEDAGLAFDWSLEEPQDAPALESSTVHALRSIVREAVGNAIRHARARRLRVRLARGAEGLRLVVEDDGRGFDPDALSNGQGLASIQARAASLRGTATWASGPEGTRLTVALPL